MRYSSYRYRIILVNNEMYFTGMFNCKTFGGKTEEQAYNDFKYLVKDFIKGND